MASDWLLPAAVLAGSALIASAMVAPTLLALREDLGTKARRECESLVREAFPDSTEANAERLVRVCIAHRAGIGR